MIQMESRLAVADNTGAKELMARETLLRTIANTPQTSPKRGETGTSKPWSSRERARSPGSQRPASW